MRILHVCETVLGGTGSHINELAPRQSQLLGVESLAVLVPAEHRSYLTALPDESVTTFSRPSRCMGLLSLVPAYIKTVKTFRPDVIHAHSTFAGLVTRILHPFLNIPIVYTPHGWAMYREGSVLKQKAFALIEWGLSFLCKKIIAVSEHEREMGIKSGISASKIITIRNGISVTTPSAFPSVWKDQRLKVLFIGRLDRQKGVDVLLRAIDGLEDRLSVRIIGDTVIGGTAFDFSAFPHVSSLGWQTQEGVAAHMMACDVIVMPSRWEGLPIAALEAMRLSKPIIATSVGGLPEVIEDKKSGFLFASEDSLALRVTLMQTNKDELSAMGHRGRIRFSQSFKAETMVAAILSVYQDCVDVRASQKRPVLYKNTREAK